MNVEQLDISLVEHMISDLQLARFADTTEADQVLAELKEVILSGWPESKGQVSAKLQEFWNYRDELTI